MERKQRSWVVCCLSVALAVVSGCDNTPNPAFEQELKDRAVASTGDPYVMLEQKPRQYRYMRQSATERPVVIQQDLLSYGAAYESLLGGLGAMPMVPALQEIGARCKQTYARVVAFRSNKPADVPAASKSLFDELVTCRDDALKAGQNADEETEAQAFVLRRFASSGVLLLGVCTVAHGAGAEGLQLWRDGEELSAKDRPGFKLNPRQLLNN